MNTVYLFINHAAFLIEFPLCKAQMRRGKAHLDCNFQQGF